MTLERMAKIHPGHLNRDKIQPTEGGSHRLLQARDIKAGVLRCTAASLINFNPKLSSRDTLLQDGDIVFMARGMNNYASILSQVPDHVLAASSFFIIRTSIADLDPHYLVWYLNQPRAQHYFTQNSGRGVHMPVVRRSVLEQIDVPFPPLETQKLIGELFRLSLDEQELTKTLLAKRARLMEAVCLRAAEREES